MKSCNPNDYPQFDKLSPETIREKAAKLKAWIWENDKEFPNDRLSVSKDCIINIIDLVERRRVYFHVFHRIEMSEWNETALYCFWIAKLQPFFEIPLPNVVARPSNEVNALIAARMLNNTVKKIRKRNGKRKLDQLNLGNVIHSFRYRDISKEAVMSIFENLISA